MVKIDTKFVTKTVVPRVVKAAIWGALTFLVMYQLPQMLIPSDIPAGLLPFDVKAKLLDFAIIAVFFAVVGKLLAGTIYGCAFGIGKAIVIMVYFFGLANGGILDMTFPVADTTTLSITVDISNILLMVVSVNLLSITKNLFEAITLMTDKSSTFES
jgi:hypothetical protein